MTKEAYAEDLDRRLHAISEQIDEMEKAYRRGSPQERVVAAGDLEVFKTRRSEIVEKKRRLEQQSPSVWGPLRTELAKDMDAFSAELGRFVLQDRRYE